MAYTNPAFDLDVSEVLERSGMVEGGITQVRRDGGRRMVEGGITQV